MGKKKKRGIGRRSTANSSNVVSLLGQATQDVTSLPWELAAATCTTSLLLLEAWRSYATLQKEALERHQGGPAGQLWTLQDIVAR